MQMLKIYSTSAYNDPIGCDYDSKQQEYLINEHEASAVKLIFEMYASGAGYNTILNVSKSVIKYS